MIAELRCILFALWIALLCVVGIGAWALGSKANDGPKLWRWVARACGALLLISVVLKLLR